MGTVLRVVLCCPQIEVDTRRLFMFAFLLVGMAINEPMRLNCVGNRKPPSAQERIGVVLVSTPINAWHTNNKCTRLPNVFFYTRELKSWLAWVGRHTLGLFVRLFIRPIDPKIVQFLFRVRVRRFNVFLQTV